MDTYDYLLFDLDGTIFDIKKVEIFVLKQVLEQNNLKYNIDIFETYSKINEKLWIEFEKGTMTKSQVRFKRFEILIKQFFTESKVDITKISNEYFNLFSKTVIAFDGAETILQKLKDKYKLFVISNGSVDVQYYKLETLGFTKYFNKIFLSEEIGFAKPNEKFFEFVYNSIGCPLKENVLVIGDSISADIIGGNNFGFNTCYVGQQKCDISTFNIKDISHLTDII